ncbi:MAG: PIN domain-containing protein [Candidatus Rokubacteria bacterium]|nr:PIN domain-containing protein [Candidatus Rokubacteria bacterium]
MIAVDTNLLIYAHRAGLPEHRTARLALERAASMPDGWGISHTSVAEFWSIVTHPASAGRASSGAEAAAFLSSLVDEGGAQVWLPPPGFPERLVRLAAGLNVQGPRIFDLQIALTAFEHGAREMWTHDRHFVSVPGLWVRDPLVPGRQRPR